MTTHLYKQISIENHSPSGQTCVFDYKYVKLRNKMVLNKSIEKACLERDRARTLITGRPEYNKIEINKLKFYITEGKREDGYLTASRYGEDCFVEETARKEISYTELLTMFEK